MALFLWYWLKILPPVCYLYSVQSRAPFALFCFVLPCRHFYFCVVQFISVCFIASGYGVTVRMSVCMNSSPLFSPRNSVVSFSYIFRPLVHLRFIHIYDTKHTSDFILFQTAAPLSRHHVVKGPSLAQRCVAAEFCVQSGLFLHFVFSPICPSLALPFLKVESLYTALCPVVLILFFHFY